MSPSKRRAPIKSRSLTALSHLDLENLVVALFAEQSRAWPNAFYALGYRLHYFDASISLLMPTGAHRDIRPDAIGHHPGRNIALVIECKTGSDIGIHQVPEGGRESADQWAEAISIPRGSLITPKVHGLLMAEMAHLIPKLDEIERASLSWLRVEPGFPVDPNNLPDDRIQSAMANLPRTPWPRSYVPYSYDTTNIEDLERVIAAIGPLILEAAYKGQVYVEADALARRTHDAVWSVSDKHRRTGWTSAAAKALETLATGKLRDFVAYDRTLKRIKLLHVRAGIGTDARTMAALKKAITAGHRRAQLRARRVAATTPTAMQTTLFPDDEL